MKIFFSAELNRHLLIIFFICFGVVSLWFKDGYIMGTAEAVLPFYKLDRYLYLTEYAWTFHPGLGNIAGLTVASKPTFFILSYLQNLGIPGYILQASIYLFILVSAGIGTYFLTEELLPNLPKKYYLFSALFYIFNPISLVDIWNRFLLNFIFFYGLLPIAVFIFLKGINEKKYFFSLILPLISLFYSYAFSGFAFNLLFWVIPILITFFYLIISKNWAERFFYIKYFFLTLLFFSLTNAWYLSQLLNFIEPSGFDSNIRVFQSQQVNVSTLEGLSKKMGSLIDLYRLNNTYFFNELGLSWIGIYNSFPIVLIDFVMTGMVLYGFFKGRQKKGVLILGLVLLVGIFLSKGSNPPLGDLFKIFFKEIPSLQIFRNPVEKFSFIVILVFPPLFSLGLYYLSRAVSKKIALTIFLIVIMIWSYPFFTGLVLTAKDPPNNDPRIGFKVDVPTYYEQANNFFESKGDNFRVIGFPMADEGITYFWSKGYQGADIPSALFSMPVVFFNTSVPYYYSLVKELEPALNGEGNFDNIANYLNARFILVREDVDFKFRNLEDPKKIEQKISERERKGELTKVAEFGKLKVWENNNWKDRTFYPAVQVIATDEGKLINLEKLSSNEVLYEGKSFFGNQKNLPKISYQKINPAFYKVKVEKATNPYMLVFSETYNSKWEAFMDGQKVDKHFRVNVYANGWEIDKEGNYQIEVKFAPQNWLEITEKVSIISIVFGLIYLFILRLKKSQ